MTEKTITELEVKQAYQSERLNEYIEKINILDKKIDKLLKNFNDLKLKSTQDDTALELRLKAIETRLDANSDRARLELTVISILLMLFTLFVNILGPMYT